PPASTAVSSPAFCAGVSAAGGGMVTADSACAAKGAAATASASRAVRIVMAVIPVRGLPSYTGDRARRHHTFLHVGVRGISSTPPMALPQGGCRLIRSLHSSPEGVAMRRREFVALVGGVAAAGAWPSVVRAQQSALPVVAVVNSGSGEGLKSRAAAFRKGLSEAGLVEGKDVTIEYHWLEGRTDQLPAVMADLVKRKVSVIATPGSVVAALAAKAATTTIPIAFAVPEDPVGLGLVATLGRPGGNATGINTFSQEVTGKRLRLLRDLVPKATRIAVLVNPGNASSVQ